MKAAGGLTIGLLGKGGGKLLPACDLALVVKVRLDRGYVSPLLGSEDLRRLGNDGWH